MPETAPASTLAPDDIDAIEQATLAALVPNHLAQWRGWLLPFGTGPVKRLRSAVALWQAEVDRSNLRQIEARYADAPCPMLWRVSDLPHFAPLRQHLLALGYRADPVMRVEVQIADCQHLLKLAASNTVELTERPGADWPALYADAVSSASEGAERVASMSRAASSRFASLRQDGQTLACGVAALSHGWLSIHGLRTREDQRGRGHARQLLRAMAEAALDQGIRRCFLQVEEDNAAALALYRRAGFATVWRYQYWSRPVELGGL